MLTTNKKHCYKTSEVAAKTRYTASHNEIGFFLPEILMKELKCSRHAVMACYHIIYPSEIKVLMKCFRHAVMASYPAELTTDIPEHSFLDSGKTYIYYLQKGIERVRNCPDITILNSLFGLCPFVLLNLSIFTSEYSHCTICPRKCDLLKTFVPCQTFGTRGHVDLALPPGFL